MGFAIEEATIESIQAALQAKELSVTELVAAYLERIERIDPALNSIVHAARPRDSRAEQLDRGDEPRGPLHGIPVVLKDNIQTADMPTAFGSVAMQGYRPPDDATVTRRLRDAGAVILVKTTLPDWATSWFSYSSLTNETRNPYDTEPRPRRIVLGHRSRRRRQPRRRRAGHRLRRLDPRPVVVLQPRRRPFHARRHPAHRHLLPRDPAGHRRPDDAHRHRRRAVFEVLAGYDPADPYSAARSPPRPGELDGAALEAPDRPRDQRARRRPGVTAVIAQAVEDMRTRAPSVDEVEIPDLFDLIVATSMYTDRSKHDLDRFLSELEDPPITRLAEAYEAGRYDQRLDLMDAIIDGPDDPDTRPGLPETLRHTARVHARRRQRHGPLRRARVPERAGPAADAGRPRRVDDSDVPDEHADRLPDLAAGDHRPAGFTPENAPVGLEIVGRPTPRRRCSGSPTPTSRPRATDRAAYSHLARLSVTHSAIAAAIISTITAG